MSPWKMFPNTSLFHFLSLDFRFFNICLNRYINDPLVGSPAFHFDVFGWFWFFLLRVGIILLIWFHLQIILGCRLFSLGYRFYFYWLLYWLFCCILFPLFWILLVILMVMLLMVILLAVIVPKPGPSSGSSAQLEFWIQSTLLHLNIVLLFLLSHRASSHNIKFWLPQFNFSRNEPGEKYKSNARKNNAVSHKKNNGQTGEKFNNSFEFYS